MKCELIIMHDAALTPESSLLPRKPVPMRLPKQSETKEGENTKSN